MMFPSGLCHGHPGLEVESTVFVTMKEILMTQYRQHHFGLLASIRDHTEGPAWPRCLPRLDSHERLAGRDYHEVGGQ